MEILNKLRRNYYFIYLLLIISAVAGFCLARYVEVSEDNKITIATIGIALLLVSVPYSFFYYKRQIEKLKKESEEQQQKEIERVVNIRLALVSVPLMINIILYYITANTSLIFAAGMSALILIYIKPSARIFLVDLAQGKKDTNDENVGEK